MRSLFLFISAIVLAALLHGSTLATERIFTYTYQSNVLAQGQKEIEIWNTLHWQREHFYRKFRHRVEYEVGLGGNVQTAFYLNVQSVAAFEPGTPPSIDKELEVGFSNEWKFKISDPLADAVGSAGYLEFSILPDELELEGKIILDKQIGNTTHALNLVAEPEWKQEVVGNGMETEFELGVEFDYGFSYQLNGNWNLGFELRNHSEYTKDNGWEHAALFGGPVVAYRTSGWWFTLTVLPQLYAFKNEPGNTHNHLELQAHERIETRLLFAYEF